MKEATLEQIESLAMQLVEANQPWHYHFLSPICVFNDSEQFALILEAPDRILIHKSKTPAKQLSAKLSLLLHRVSNDKQDQLAEDYSPTPDSAILINRARELTDQGIEWHHHVLFPGCTFNTGTAWILMIEDPVSGSVLESKSGSEPTEDLKQIEPLFYKQ